MAEVLSPPLQPSASITMMHSRPSSADAFQGSPPQYSHPSRRGQPSRALYNTAHTSYRGVTSAPVQPYAFQATPKPLPLTSPPGTIGGHRHAPSASASTTSSDTSSLPSGKDDSVMGSRDGSSISLSTSIPDASLHLFDAPAKPSPERYHRPNPKRPDANASTMAPSAPVAPPPPPPPQAEDALAGTPAPAPAPFTDDMAVSKTGSAELAKRYRRRSLNQLDTHDLPPPTGLRHVDASPSPSATSTPTAIRPASLHSRAASAEGGTPPPVKDAAAAAARPADKASSTPAARGEAKPASNPSRGAADAGRRVNAPSPLSRQAVGPEEESAAGPRSPEKPKTYAAAARAGLQSSSPAAQHLAAVSDRDLNKGMKSRLRRAFSFGGAQQLQRSAAENSVAQPTKQQHQQQIDEELDAEQQAIARRQEAAGIGAGIYSGQGGFAGSTDNLSISSTASSASMMLRKMGQGAKKGARSIKGLFRPKSVIGVPAADGPIQVSAGAGGAAAPPPTTAQVSMVTAEAERLKVNVNAAVADKPHGSTGFPKLERNSLDAANLTGPAPAPRGSADGSDSNSRRSIVGSEKDRAEVLAAVRKGILKRSGTASPAGSPVIRPADPAAAPPPFTDSPASSVPSTPKDGQPRPPLLGASLSSDYFTSRMTLSKTSVASTPTGSVRAISFSPRIQFYDAWSSTEYDRRGDIATCNRLTPMLAQQIKEELNTFKMEMEVHELSKPHTHFF